MKNLRGLILPVVMVGLVGLSGCAGSTATPTAETTTTTSTAAAAPADPKAALAGSTKELQTGNYAFTANSPEADAQGVVHIPSKSASIALRGKSEGFEIKMDMIFAGKDRWVRMASPNGASMLDEKAGADTWMHFDGSKLKNSGDLGVDLTKPDLLFVGKIVEAATDVQGDAHTITGKLDGTKIDSADAFLDSDTAKDMGAAGAALPFTATLDDQGRLTKLAIDAPKAKDVPAGKWTITLSGYGEQKAQSAPTGKVKEMSDQALKMFNS